MLTAVIRANIVGRLEAEVSAKIVSELEAKVSANIAGGGDREVYRGVYDVRPQWYDQTLETSGKVMLRDVNVASIQMLEVSNPAGGTTLSI